MDLRQYAPEVAPQDSLAMCGAEATCSWLGTLSAMAGNRQRFSPLFAWWAARVKEGNFGKDVGVTLADQMQTFVDAGCCLYSSMPDTWWQSSSSAPSAAAIAEALQYRAQNPRQVDVAACLSEPGPLVVAITVYDSLKQNVNGSGLLDMYRNLGEPGDGHVIAMLGTRDDGRAVLDFRSWGNFGDDGYVYATQDALTQIVGEIWTADLAD